MREPWCAKPRRSSAAGEADGRTWRRRAARTRRGWRRRCARPDGWRSSPSSGSRRADRPIVTAVQQLWGRVADLVRGSERPGRSVTIAALDIGTEFAKALVVTIEHDPEGRIVGVVRGTGRQRQGLAHMQSGTVSDIDAVVANCRAAVEEARAMAGRRPTATVIGIAGELVKGATSTTTVRRDDPRSPLGEPELERLVTRAQESALREAESRIRWESGMDRLRSEEHTSELQS